MKFIANLVPREGKFFEYFNQHASLIAQGSAALTGLLRNYDDVSVRQAGIDRVNDLEHEADRVTHQTTALLHTSFVTPLDRDDIHRLISRMDDVLDLMQDAAESLHLYDVQTLTPEAVELAALLQNCCERMQSAVALLSNMKNAPAALKICQEIDQAESRADQVMRAAISRLFREESDTRQLIKLKAIYELLEAATDKCQDVANVIESLILENA
jgi:predicted phosphate transport protein (TIGR00153 family)